jgi:hypothetical protein
MTILVDVESKKLETFIFLLRTRQRNLFLCHTDNIMTHSILSWQRLWPEVRVFLWAHINECPFLQQGFPVLLILDTAVWIQDNAHPQCTCSDRSRI